MEDRMTSVRVPGFRPSASGLHFPNAFPHVPNLEIDLPGGLTVPVGDAANGLCGGMAWTVRDLFEAGLAPPDMTTAPGDGPVFHYVADRLLDSLSLPFGPATYLKLMHPALPDGDLAMVHDRAGTRLTLRLYDPNHPDNDEVTLSLDTARPRRPTPVTSSDGATVWCFFRTAYSFKDPRPALA